MNIEGQGEGKLTKNYKFSFFCPGCKKINNCLLDDWQARYMTCHCIIHVSFVPHGKLISSLNPFAPGDFAEKRVLKLVEWFSGHCRAIKS